MTSVLAWAYYAFVQLVSLLATIVGWVVLIPFCLARAWCNTQSTFDPSRQIDRWSWKPLNVVYGNPEDGVSGMKASLWNDNGTAKEPYMPTSWAPWRAYRWSAIRNSADGLKYVFAWSKGPLTTVTVFGKTFKLGWQEENGIKVPVL